MSLFRTILSLFRAGRAQPAPVPADWHELRVSTVLPPPDDAAVVALLNEVKSAIAAADAGLFDEYEEYGEGAQICVYLNGPSADHLLDAVTPVLHRHAWTAGAEIYRAYGNPMDASTREVITTLPS